MEHIWEAYGNEFQNYRIRVVASISALLRFLPDLLGKNSNNLSLLFLCILGPVFLTDLQVLQIILTHVSVAFSLDETQFVWVSGHV